MHGLVAPTADEALMCRVWADLPLASLSSASVADGAILYHLNQRAGPIHFSVDQCGLFEARGRVTRYNATLALDRAKPLGLHAELAFDTASVCLAEAGRAALPFAPWFDAAAYPKVRFRTSALTQASASRYLVRGLLEIAGITRLHAIDAELVGRDVDPITGTDVAELVMRHRLSASAFGMLPGQTFLCDRIDLQLRARIELEA